MVFYIASVGGRIVAESRLNITCKKCHDYSEYMTGKLTCSTCNKDYGASRYLNCSCGTLYNPTGKAPGESCTVEVFNGVCQRCGGDGLVGGLVDCKHGMNSSHSYCSHDRVSLHDN